MTLIGLSARLLVAGSVVMLTSIPALAIETKDSAIMSREIFALYGKDGRGLDLGGSAGRQVLTPGLFALVKAEEKAAKGEVGALGADPFCSCQDYEVTAVKATAKLLGPDRAEVTVAFRNFGTPQTTRLSLVKTAGGWRVADVHTAEVPSLVALLRRAIKR
jgi:hypothetical protein